MGNGLKDDSMQLNEFTHLCTNVGFPDKASKHCKLKDVDGIFVTAAFKDTDEGKRLGLDRKTLGRHEFVEAMVRLSEAKFGHGQRPDVTDLPGAVLVFCRDLLLPGLPPESVLDANAFRRTQLYTLDADAVLRAHKPLLLGLFAWYRSRLRTRGLVLEGWVALLEESRLLTDHIGPIGLTSREGKLLFVWSRMHRLDPHTASKAGAQGAITLIEFIEAIARTADLLSLPTAEDIKAGGYGSLGTYLAACDAGTATRASQAAPSEFPGAPLSLSRRRPSGDLFTLPTRPLPGKVARLLEVIMHRLVVFTQSPSEGDFMRLLKKAREKAKAF
jgi:hypothetical protein